jgi:hypothetical protein
MTTQEISGTRSDSDDYHEEVNDDSDEDHDDDNEANRKEAENTKQEDVVVRPNVGCGVARLRRI